MTMAGNIETDSSSSVVLHPDMDVGGHFLNIDKLTRRCKIIDSFGRIQGGANVNFVR